MSRGRCGIRKASCEGEEGEEGRRALGMCEWGAESHANVTGLSRPTAGQGGTIEV